MLRRGPGVLSDQLPTDKSHVTVAHAHVEADTWGQEKAVEGEILKIMKVSIQID